MVSLNVHDLTCLGTSAYSVRIEIEYQMKLPFVHFWSTSMWLEFEYIYHRITETGCKHWVCVFWGRGMNVTQPIFTCSPSKLTASPSSEFMSSTVCCYQYNFEPIGREVGWPARGQDYLVSVTGYEMTVCDLSAKQYEGDDRHLYPWGIKIATFQESKWIKNRILREASTNLLLANSTLYHSFLHCNLCCIWMFSHLSLALTNLGLRLS